MRREHWEDPVEPPLEFQFPRCLDPESCQPSKEDTVATPEPQPSEQHTLESRHQEVSACASSTEHEPQWRDSEIFTREWYRIHPKIAARRKLLWKLKKYGLSVPVYDKMLKRFNGCCWICLKLPPRGRSLAIDHCHSTGKVRGLLCTPCNYAIGMLRDDPATVRRAHVYLSRRDKLVGWDLVKEIEDDRWSE